MGLRFTVLIFLLGVFAGCTATTRIQRTVYEPKAAYPLTHPNQVKILTHFPRQEHIQVGKIKLEDDGFIQKDYGPQDGTDFEKTLKIEAARMGGHALIVLEDKAVGQMMKEGGYAETYSQIVTGTHSSEHIMKWQDYGRQVTGIVIRLKEPDDNSRS